MRKYLIIILLLAVVFSAFAQQKDYPANLTEKDRVMGAIMGVLIGDALGIGCHWWYDLTQFHADFGPWVSDYLDPIDKGTGDSTKSPYTWAHQRVIMGVKAGDVSQTGQFIIMLLESVAEKGTFDVSDFTRRVDEFFKTIDGTSMGPKSGRYTDDAMRQTWANRHKGISWDDPNVGANSITSEAAQHSVILAALYFKIPEKVFTQAYREISLFYNNDFARTQSVAYALNVAGFISALPIEEIKTYRSKVPRDVSSKVKLFSDSLNQIETGRSLAYGVDTRGTPLEAKISFEPPYLISQVYGAHCEIQQLLPAAYYLIHRYPDDFEMAVLSAVNGGGYNMARAALTGGMSGAMNGLSGIPERFITGLKDHERLLKLAEKVADIATRM